MRRDRRPAHRREIPQEWIDKNWGIDGAPGWGEPSWPGWRRVRFWEASKAPLWILLALALSGPGAVILFVVKSGMLF